MPAACSAGRSGLCRRAPRTSRPCAPGQRGHQQGRSMLSHEPQQSASGFTFRQPDTAHGRRCRLRRSGGYSASRPSSRWSSPCPSSSAGLTLRHGFWSEIQAAQWQLTGTCGSPVPRPYALMTTPTPTHVRIPCRLQQQHAGRSACNIVHQRRCWCRHWRAASAMAAAAMPPAMQANVAKGAAALGLPPEVPRSTHVPI